MSSLVQRHELLGLHEAHRHRLAREHAALDGLPRLDRPLQLQELDKRPPIVAAAQHLRWFERGGTEGAEQV